MSSSSSASCVWWPPRDQDNAAPWADAAAVEDPAEPELLQPQEPLGVPLPWAPWADAPAGEEPTAGVEAEPKLLQPQGPLALPLPWAPWADAAAGEEPTV